MAKADLIPGPADPKPASVIPTTLSLDEENLTWLDGLATQLNRSRSEVAREIFRRVRAMEAAGDGAAA